MSADLALEIDRHGKESLGHQVRRGLLAHIRAGILRPGVVLPSTRALAAQLGISRPLIVDAYAQLAAEGFLIVRRGARPIVASGAARVAPPLEEKLEQPIRYDLRPAMPDVGLFPRKAWASAIRTVLNAVPANDLGYGDLRGSPRLRSALADYLGRVRGVVADPSHIFITSGFAEGRALACVVMRAVGLRRVAVEDPGYSDWVAVDKAGLERVPIPVDEQGIDVDQLIAAGAEGALITPSHQFPIGGVLSAGRRQRLVRWLEQHDGYVLEDDYDAEFRYDQASVGALQGLAADRVIYAGTASKTLAPALRIGWLVVPPELVRPMDAELRRWKEGSPRIEQDALAHLLQTGAYDRHLRKMRRIYRDRRKHLLDCLAAELPELEIEGTAAGLHVTLRLPSELTRADEAQIVSSLRERGLATEGLGRYSLTAEGPRRLFVGYGRVTDSAIASSVRLLAKAVRAAQRHELGP
ncbi:transcriptional regulator with HTH domain and aminotransferase domain [Mesorhizobium japonicum R7A]|nr:transcriptional regulator with HTH domain and aminotransferase domain [Mesorhizobium japonicum R7A]